MNRCKTSLTIFLFIILQISSICNSVPLSTSSRWIVDQVTGKRVKLACVNLVSHLEPMIAEGLEKKPLNHIASQIVANGFNCVRLTWATFMFTRPEYKSLTVNQSLDKNNLKAAKSGISKNNPQILNMKIIDVHNAVVNELGKNNLMVVLDNHVSEPKWCCGSDDGNGFFGDPSFDPKEWLKGLEEVASAYTNNSAVVGMSLRNELRGKKQNVADWYKYMQQGANTIHKQNPNLLVIISGLYYASNLKFLRKKQLQINVKNKTVYEAHWYSFGIPSQRNWPTQTNQECANITQAARENYLFLTQGDNPFPIFLSEFGIDQSGQKEADNRYISCLFAMVAEYDLDWALWTFQGSYMLREGSIDVDETYGVMDHNWNSPRNLGFLKRLQFAKHVNQETKSSRKIHYMILHPQSGLCVRSKAGRIFLDTCEKASRWDRHKHGKPIKLVSRSSRCLAAARDGKAASVSNDCLSGWEYGSSSGLHLAVGDGQGKYMCLEKNGWDNTLVTKKCLCVRDDLVDFPTCADNPQVQWFKFVPTNSEVL
ncbi:hypothetical protein CASFOL_020174 [Castilleja foliolosa]|uniref:Glycoside hydrolase family 5 domain-containing protein n=1 Tax=Castilleja foliolosa TaxID=1961234 RepID=A0ABD3D4A3_9LAMI